MNAFGFAVLYRELLTERCVRRSALLVTIFVCSVKSSVPASSFSSNSDCCWREAPIDAPLCNSSWMLLARISKCSSWFWIRCCIFVSVVVADMFCREGLFVCFGAVHAPLLHEELLRCCVCECGLLLQNISDVF